MGPDALHGSTGVSLLGHSGLGGGGRRDPGTRFYPFPRLLSRLLLCVTPGKNNPRLCRRYFDIHPVRRLEVRPQYTSCHRGRRWPTGRRGYFDDYEKGVSGSALAKTTRIPDLSKSLRLVRAGSGAAVFIFPTIFYRTRGKE